MSDRSEHFELLKQLLLDQQGELAVEIVKQIQNHGDRTLREIYDVVKESTFTCEGQTKRADEQWVKRVAAILVQHQVLSVDQTTRLYSLQQGRGLFRSLIPLVLDFVRLQYGDAGELLMSVMFEYAALPLDTLHAIAVKRYPALSGALKRAAEALRSDQLLVLADDDGPRPEKEKKLEKSLGMVYVFNVQGILAKLRVEYIGNWLGKRFGSGESEKVFKAFAVSDSNRPSARDGKYGYPALSDISSPMSLQSLAKKCEGCQQQDVDTTLTMLTSDDGGHIVTEFATNPMNVQYSFNYNLCIKAMKAELCRDVVFSRHGMLGLRIVRILEERQSMEDRHLAEECICTLPETRDVLRAMMADGFIRQQELPRIANADRQPKHSIVLWVLNMQALEQLVSRVFVKTMRTLKARLTSSTAVLRSQLPTSYLHDPTSTTLTAEHEKVVAQIKQTETVLNRALLSLQESVLLVDFL